MLAKNFLASISVVLVSTENNSLKRIDLHGTLIFQENCRYNFTF